MLDTPTGKSGKRIIGYTVGVYDMFHIGHLNVIKNAKENCDVLIVGVNSDELTYSYKNKYPIIPETERIEIVRSIKYVDKAELVDEIIRVDDNGKISAFEKHHFDVVFIGDDHRKVARWQEVDEYLRKHGAKVCFLPYTKHISSSKLAEIVDKMLISF